MPVPAPGPVRRFVIVELPVQVSAGHVHCVVEATRSARTLSALAKPAIFVSNVATLAFDWLVVPLPAAVTVDAPIVMIFGTVADALAKVIEPPALGSGPVSFTAFVKTGAAGTVTVDLT